jgi:hypothetical protein
LANFASVARQIGLATLVAETSVQATALQA